MKIIAMTTEEIRNYILDSITMLEEDSQLHFPDGAAREEFLEECVTCIADKYDFYDGNYTPDFDLEVLDTAGYYGYLTD